ncbi:unnamed protein product [Pylaiella littoralis]
MEKEEPTLSRRDTHGPFARMGLGSKTSSKASMGVGGAEENERLHCVITEKDAAITALQFEVQRLSNELASHTRVAKREHPLEPVIHLVDEQGSGRPGGHMGRTASMATATALSSLQPRRKHDEMAQRVIRMFKTPKEHATYLTSVKFARDMLRLCARAGPIFENEPRCLFIQSPVYVFGDIHGNLEDLNFFADNIWKLGMNLTAGKFLFLGDYVDRGMSGLECLAYLFALKIENPDKIFMLRGNHELRDVNGWVEHYGERSFLWQCQDRFGDDLGEEVWEGCNAVFDRLPLASVIDHDIFCVHGGIPRPLPESTSRVQDILCVPSVAGVCPPNEYETFESQQVASDCLWSDPARDNQEMSLDATGFGESLRGGGDLLRGQGDRRLFDAGQPELHRQGARGAFGGGVAEQGGQGFHGLLDLEGPRAGEGGHVRLHPRGLREAPGDKPVVQVQEPVHSQERQHFSRSSQSRRQGQADAHRGGDQSPLRGSS